MTNGSSQGLFVIVAVVIFGIFVAISYVLFQDQMRMGLSEIFCEGFTISNEYSGLGGKTSCTEDNNGNGNGNGNGNENGGNGEDGDGNGEDGVGNGNGNENGGNGEDGDGETSGEMRGKCSINESHDIVGAEETSTYAFADISRSGNPVWVTLDKRTGTIIDSKGSRKDLKTKQDIGTAGNYVNTKNLEVPCTINGVAVKHVGDYAFSNAKFSGDIILSSNVETMGNYSVHKANFTGDFIAPSVKKIGMSAFQNSYLVGDFYAPNVDEIVQTAFYRSNFKGDFYIKKGAKVGGNNGNIIARSKEIKY